MDIKELLSLTVKNKASDLHLMVGIAPTFRIDGVLRTLTTSSLLKAAEIETMVFSLLTPEQKELFLTNKELDFSFSFSEIPDEELGRFRVNAYFQRGTVSAVMRFLTPSVRSIEQLGLPKICHTFSGLRQGFVIVAGPPGMENQLRSQQF